jgi:AcrR family transcriptional regulator
MGKGQETKRAIVDEALDLVSTGGLDGLSIGTLARATGMSKSGLFAHFQSKEQLQLTVLNVATDRFVDIVIAPALKQPRGEPRIVAMFENAMKRWENELPGGCIFHAVSAELDDKPGPARDFLIKGQLDYQDTIHRAAEIAVEEGHFRKDLDLDQFVFEFSSIAAAFHHSGRLLGKPDAEKRAYKAFAGLLARSH